ncbi:MAG: hypothetical protein AAGC68_00490 [Verrucomicrobiota bacterium]
MTSPDSNQFAIFLAILLFLFPYSATSDEGDLDFTLPPETMKAIEKASANYARQFMSAIVPVLDEDKDGAIGLREMTMHLMARGYAKVGGPLPEEEELKARAMRRQESIAEQERGLLKLIETDEKGNFREEEMAGAFEKAIAYLLRRLGPLDANGDNKLSLAEYAVGFPVTGDAERDEEGYTDYQRQFFARKDTDGSGYVEGDEYLGDLSYVDETLLVSTAAILIHRADADGDGSFSKDELKTLLPAKDDLPESLPLGGSIYWLRELPSEQVLLIKNQLVEEPE